MATVYNAFAKETLTVSTTSVVLTASVYAPSGQTAAKRAVIQPQAQAIRYWRTGATPTGTTGVYAAANTLITLASSSDIANFKAIRDSGAGGDATVVIEYER